MAQILAAGAPIPAAIAYAAEPADDEQIFWLAFWQLGTCRPFRGAPIGWNSVRLWATSHGLHALAEAELGAVVRALDQRYLEHWEREAKRQAAQPEGSPPGGNRRSSN